MAIIKPKKLVDFTNKSEELAYNLLKNLDDSYTVVYEPEIGKTKRRTPDFVVMSEEYGLIVLDVKHVNLSSIQNSDKNKIIKKDNTTLPNFYKTVKNYGYIINNFLVEEFKDNKDIVYQPGSKFAGKLTFPHSSGILLYVTDYERYTKEDIAKILSLNENDFLVINDPKNQNIEEIVKFIKNLHRPFKKGISKSVQGEILKKIYLEENMTSTEFIKSISSLKKELENRFIETLNGNHFNKSKQLKQNIINYSNFSINAIELSNKNLSLGFDNLIERIKQHKEELEDEKFTIAVFGYFSSGKSTFLNVLMGTDILPMDEDRTTATFTRLRHTKANEEVSDGDMEVVYKSKDEIALIYKESLSDLGFNDEKDKKFYDFDKLDQFKDELLERINSIKIRDFDRYQRDRIKNGKKILKYLLSNKIPYGSIQKVKKEYTKEYLTDDDKAIAISEVIYYLDNDLLKDVEIVDTPGFGSSNTLDTLKTQAFLKEVNAVILLTDAKAPLSHEQDQKFLENYVEIFEKDGQIDTSKLFIVLNKIDTTKKNVNEVKKALYKELEDNWEDELKIPENHIFTISAKYHFDILTKQTSDIESENINKKDLDNFIKVYSTYLTKDKDKSLIADNLKRINGVINEIEKDLLKKIESLNLDIQEIRKRKAKFNKNKIEIEQRFKNYNDAISGIETQLNAYIKKRLDEQKLTYTIEENKKLAIEKTAQAYENYLISIGLKSDKANEKTAKDFYISFVKKIYEKINNENIKIFKEQIDEKIKLLNTEIERYVKELEVEYGVSGLDRNIIISNLNTKDLGEIDLDVSLLSKLFDFLLLGFFINAKDFAENMVEQWNDKDYNLIYQKIIEANNTSIRRIKTKLNAQTKNIVDQIERKLNQLEQNLLKKQENQQEYQEKLNNFKNIFNFIDKYQNKIKSQYKSLYGEEI